MRSARLLAVAALVVVLVLVSAENAFAIQIEMQPTCGQPPPGELTVTGRSGDIFIDVTTWGSGWEGFVINCGGAKEYSCELANFGTTGGFTITFTDDLGSASATYTVDCPAVGGVVTPANTFVVFAPWLALVGLVGCIGTVVVVAKKRQS